MQERTTATLQDLLAMEDEVGVITVSIGFAPSSYADGPTGPESVRASLRKLGADHDERDAIQQRVEELSDRLDALLDPRGEGRGRYLAATVEGGEVIEHRLQVPLPPMAEFDDGPTLRHLLEAFDEHEPAAALLMHANEAKLLEVGWTGHEELQDWEFRVGEIVLGDENTGPGPSSPSGAPGGINPGGVTHRDQQQDRVRENQDRFLRDVVGEVRSEVERRNLDRLVLVGPAHERNVVREAFGSGNGVRLLDVDRTPSGAGMQGTLEAIADALSREHAAHEEELVATARDRARSAGRGALGAGDVTAALAEGRVAHLLLSPELELHGWVTEGGGLVIDENDPRTEEARPEPRFVHRMIERAMATDGMVTPVDGTAAELLDELGGVAALLRW
jgi:hypothetical protein